jgi:acyl dehydratase
MLHAGILATYATDWLGPENIRRFKVRFRDVVYPGDVLTYSGQVLRKHEDNGERRVEIELSCRRETGATAVQGWATFVLP